MQNSITFRLASKQDKLILAQSMIEASGYLCEFLLNNIIPNADAKTILALEIGKNNSPLSYQHSLIAECNGEVVGTIIAYPSHYFTAPRNSLIPPDRLTCIAPFYHFPLQKSLYIDTLIVQKKLRGHGIGKLLLQQIFDKAHTLQLNKLSLYVWENNATALKLYHQFGFYPVTTVYPNPHPEFKTDYGRILMYADC